MSCEMRCTSSAGLKIKSLNRRHCGIDITHHDRSEGLERVETLGAAPLWKRRNRGQQPECSHVVDACVPEDVVAGVLDTDADGIGPDNHPQPPVEGDPTAVGRRGSDGSPRGPRKQEQGLMNQSSSLGSAHPFLRAAPARSFHRPIILVGSVGVSSSTVSTGAVSPVGCGLAKRSPVWTWMTSSTTEPMAMSSPCRKRAQVVMRAFRLLPGADVEALGEPDSLELPGRTLRQLIEEDDASRDLESGE